MTPRELDPLAGATKSEGAICKQTPLLLSLSFLLRRASGHGRSEALQSEIYPGIGLHRVSMKREEEVCIYLSVHNVYIKLRQ